ncbi:hypothetical protein FOZ60_002614 [Perkinsus olseni]|uniref:Uncharacterized protein n=1 Tax=Perkinsus olseni TaxID=32597 RepID=A0A7J6NY98_PEROL|nr:hypothetical protein FOZ60_002614 [Perkinsus olseni]
MRSILQLFLLLCFPGLATSQGPSEFTSPHGNNLELYKAINFPWNVKEVPICFNSTLCPREASYTWDHYFDYLVHGKITVFPEFYLPWDKTGFEALRRRVDAGGGKILADLRLNSNYFNKTAFLKSAATFVKDYRVDGFFVRLPFNDAEAFQPLEDVFEAAKKLNILSSLWFSSDDWKRVKEKGLGKKADINFVTLWPNYADQIQDFNTDCFAGAVINNVTKAGIDLNKLVMTIPLLARANEHSDSGYSGAIYDCGGDPKGNGSIACSPGDDFYFFSQRRAIDKIGVAKKHGLHGIALSGGDFLLAADLYPWDKDSLIHALAASD